MAYIRNTGYPPKLGFFARQSITNVLIIINAIIFFMLRIWSSMQPSVFDFIAIKPASVLEGNALWTIVTSMFMHAGFFHLFVNMFSLFFIGNLVEKIIGRKRYVWLYLTAGVIASLFFVFLAYTGQFIPRGEFLFGGIDDFAVGASGAIFGLLGVLAVLLPKKEVYLIMGPLIVIVLQFLIGGIVPSISGTVDIIATVLIFLMIFSIFSSNDLTRKIALPLRLPFWLAPIIAIVPLVVIGYFLPEKLPIGNSAHFGGLVAGLLYGVYLRNKYSKKVKLLNKYVG